MKFISYFVLLTVSTVTHSSVYSDVKNNVLNFLQRSINSNYEEPSLKHSRGSNRDLLDAKTAQEKADIVKKSKKTDYSHETSINRMQSPRISRHRFRIDPVLNSLGRRSNKYRDDSTAGSVSSSSEEQNWKDEWREHWIQKKFEAINSSGVRGDVVNMVAARPWGTPCGDPNQHDMPWGSCMLPMECDAEYRIYRGDYFCGRTQFVCCAVQQTAYDMYQGFDISFADSSLATDSEEKRSRNLGSKENQRKKKQVNKRNRRRDRLKRKRQIKRDIHKIIKEIRKILSRSYRNGTTMRKLRTKQLKKFVMALKQQYKKDRQSVKSIHELELIKIDHALQQKLGQIKGVNQEFMKNQTFRDIIVNGTANPSAVRMLVQEYPELARMLDETRRSNGAEPDYLEYDVEYGLLYY